MYKVLVDHHRASDTNLEVNIPAVRPSDIRWYPLYIVSVNYLIGFLDTLKIARVVLSRIHFVTAAQRRGVLVEFLQAVPLVVDTEGNDLEPDDTRALESLVVFVVLKHDPHVIVQEVHAAASLEGRWCHEANWETTRHVVVLFVAHRTRHLVHDPIDAVLIVDDAAEQPHIRFVVVLFTQDFARVRHLHLDLVQRTLDHVTLEHLTQIFARTFGAFRLAER